MQRPPIDFEWPNDPQGAEAAQLADYVLHRAVDSNTIEFVIDLPSDVAALLQVGKYWFDSQLRRLSVTAHTLAEPALREIDGVFTSFMRITVCRLHEKAFRIA